LARSAQSTASEATRNSPATPASHRSTPAPANTNTNAIASTRGGNRQRTCALHRIAITQGRVRAPARVYLERKQNQGKSRREAIRCLKRQPARTVYSTLKTESAST
jgi:transposase